MCRRVSQAAGVKVEVPEQREQGRLGLQVSRFPAAVQRLEAGAFGGTELTGCLLYTSRCV